MKIKELKKLEVEGGVFFVSPETIYLPLSLYPGIIPAKFLGELQKADNILGPVFKEHFGCSMEPGLYEEEGELYATQRNMPGYLERSSRGDYQKVMDWFWDNIERYPSEDFFQEARDRVRVCLEGKKETH